METDVETLTYVINNFKERTPLTDKLSEKEKHKIRKVTKNVLLSISTESNAMIALGITSTLFSLFGKEMFNDILKLYEDGKLYRNTKI